MTKVFMNPVLEQGADPWMYKHTDAKYYFMITLGNRLELWASAAMTGVGKGERKTIWIPPVSGPGSKDIWAPELHHIQGVWQQAMVLGIQAGAFMCWKIFRGIRCRKYGRKKVRLIHSKYVCCSGIIF